MQSDILFVFNNVKMLDGMFQCFILSGFFGYEHYVRSRYFAGTSRLVHEIK